MQRSAYEWRKQDSQLPCPVCGHEVYWACWVEPDVAGMRYAHAHCSTGPLASRAGGPPYARKMCPWTGTVELRDADSTYRVRPPTSN